MSAVPALDIDARARKAEPARPVALYSTAVVHVPRTLVDPVPGIRVRTIPSVVERVVARMACFLGIATAAYIFSALSGQVMLEQVRKEGIQAATRVQTASKLEVLTHRRLESLFNRDRIDGWANENKWVKGG